jgi:8-oxo-dGTP pyrophosphatase MutT (NUDIX family)
VSKPSPHVWRVLQSEEIYKNRFVRFRKDVCELEGGRTMPAYFVFEMKDWVNVIPVTREGRIVLLKQYRHATGEITIEIPGGSTTFQEEDPREAAARELAEETGYLSQRWQRLPKHRPNPALQNNWLHSFIAWDAEYLQEPQTDPFEDLEVFEVTPAELRDLVFAGKIDHSLILASLFMAWPHLGLLERP